MKFKLLVLAWGQRVFAFGHCFLIHLFRVCDKLFRLC